MGASVAIALATKENMAQGQGLTEAAQEALDLVPSSFRQSCNQRAQFGNFAPQSYGFICNELPDFLGQLHSCPGESL